MYRLYLLLFIATVLGFARLFAQPPQVNTYAIVIGISTYKSTQIPQLSFAANDAKLFADFIKSGGAGKTRPENIKTFYNEEANIAALYQALEWLKVKARKNDRVFIYFAGHGDQESAKEKSQGYLLAYNSPRFNYRNNALSITYLNDVANDLSIKNNAQVFIITDACHSGTLAGDFLEGKKFSNQNLLKVLNNEVRFAACAPDQLAAEGKEWGGGRGVFSYHFLNSLGKQHKTTNFKQVSNYLDSAFKRDKILKSRNHEQQPQMDGNPETILSWPIAAPKVNVNTKKSLSPMLSAGKLSPMGVQAIDYAIDKIFENLNITLTAKTQHYKANFALNCLDSLLNKQRLINQLYQNNAEESRLYSPEEIVDTLILKNLKNTLQNNDVQIDFFIEKYLLKVHNEAQEMINAYLEGDLGELERRQYYYNGKRSYKFVLSHLAQATQFITPENPLQQILKVNYYYLKAVTGRLQLSLENNSFDSLLNITQYAIEKAVELDPFAPYIQNEAGNIYFHKQQTALADSFFTLATEYAPTWAIPWSNKSRLQLAQGNLNLATKAILRADSLQPDLSFVLINKGLIEEQKGNRLLAAELYHKAIDKNEVHFLPHERLGYLYNAAMEFDLANTYFKNAFERKQLFSVNSTYFKFGIELGGIGDPFFANEPLNNCFNINKPATALKALKLVEGAIYRYNQSKTTINKSIQDLKTAIALDPETPFAQHYLGRFLYETGSFNQAVTHLRTALKQFNRNVPLLLKMIRQAKADTTCAYNFIQQANYPQKADLYLLAACLPKINKTAEAIEIYKKIIANENKEEKQHALLKKVHLPANLSTEQQYPYEVFDYYSRPSPVWGWFCLAKLYESLEQYHLSEKLLVQQNDFFTELTYLRDSLRSTAYISLNELPEELQELPNFFGILRTKETEGALMAFYGRMMTKQPRNPYWFQQAGLFLYYRLTPLFDYYDTKEYPGLFDFLETYAFPFHPGDKGKDDETVRLQIDGTGMYEEIEFPGYNPATKAISYLEKAIQLYKGSTFDDRLILALAQLFHWSGYHDDAIEWFNKIADNSTLSKDKQVRLALLLKEKMYWQSLKQTVEKIPIDRHETRSLQNQQIQFYILEDKPDEVLKLLSSEKPMNYADSLTHYCLLAKAQLKIGNTAGLITSLTNLINYGRKEKANEENYFERTLYFQEKEWELMLLLAKTHLHNNRLDSALHTIKAMKDVYGAPVYIFQYDTSWQFLQSDMPLKEWITEKLHINIDEEAEHSAYRYPFDQLIPLPARLHSLRLYR